jgi:hypothetical protein
MSRRIRSPRSPHLPPSTERTVRWSRASAAGSIPARLTSSTSSSTWSSSTSRSSTPRGHQRKLHPLAADGGAAQACLGGGDPPQGPHSRQAPGADTRRAKLVAAVSLWVVAAGSKLVVLELVDLVFGDAVSLGGFWWRHEHEARDQQRRRTGPGFQLRGQQPVDRSPGFDDDLRGPVYSAVVSADGRPARHGRTASTARRRARSAASATQSSPASTPSLSSTTFATVPSP